MRDEHTRFAWVFGLALFVASAVCSAMPLSPNTAYAQDDCRIAVIIRADTPIESIDSAGNIAWDDEALDAISGNLDSLAFAIEENDELSASVALSPLLLEKLAEDGGETIQATLAELAEEGRIELLKTGYSDPSIPLLCSAGAQKSVALQYSQVASASNSAQTDGLQTSGGAYPLDARLSSSALDELANTGVSWSIVDLSTMTSDYTGSLAYSLDFTDESGQSKSITALTVDATLSSLLEGGDAAAFSNYCTTLRTANAAESSVVGADLAEKGFANSLACLEQLAKSDGFSLCTGSALVEAIPSTNIPPARLTDSDGAASEQYASELASATESLDALASCLYSSSKTYDSASRLLFLAEADGVSAEVQASLANQSKTESEEMLREVWIASSNMTLAGQSGSLPVTITNNTDAALELELKVTGEGVAAQDGYSDGVQMVVYSGENYLEVPVSLSKPRATVSIELGATRTLAQTQVWAKASHINQITLYACGGLLALLAAWRIWRRRRKRRRESK